MKSKYLTAEQKEFYNELSLKFNDSITNIEMINLQCDSFQWKHFPIKPNAAQTNLWCILAFGEKDLHLYVNPTEPTILGFRVNASVIAPKEQLFSFSQFTKWSVKPIIKKTLFGLKEEKLRFQLHYTITTNNDSISNSIIVESNSTVQPIILSISKYCDIFHNNNKKIT